MKNRILFPEEGGAYDELRKGKIRSTLEKYAPSIVVSAGDGLIYPDFDCMAYSVSNSFFEGTLSPSMDFSKYQFQPNPTERVVRSLRGVWYRFNEDTEVELGKGNMPHLKVFNEEDDKLYCFLLGIDASRIITPGEFAELRGLDASIMN